LLLKWSILWVDLKNEIISVDMEGNEMRKN